MNDKNKEKLKRYVEYINDNICTFNTVNESNKEQSVVVEAMNYSLSAGGKRIRAVLVMEFCNICSGKMEDALNAAIAIEMIHTFSLIHDDLPCMDDDDYRRGKPSCHKKYGEAVALLAGDALLSRAFGIVAKSKELSPETINKLIIEMSYSVGTEGMIGGQVIDTENMGKDVSLELLKKMYYCKTTALIKAACRMGCICANASDAMLDKADFYAERIGMVFQVIDDILDVVGTQETLGKPIGSDKEQDKTTMVTIMGVDGAVKFAEKLTNEAFELLCEQEYFQECDFLKEFTKLLVVRKK